MNNNDCLKTASCVEDATFVQKVIEKGYVDYPVPNDVNPVEEIKRLKQEKNAIILAHYYTDGSIQDIADFVGDSLALAQKAAQCTSEIIVMCGVHFMGETCKILCPDKKVLVPDLNAGCSLADSQNAEDLAKFIEQHPGHTVISYVNTTAAVKYYTDIVVTSSNAKQIVESLPEDEKIIFGPDRNLGNYINAVTGRKMVLWDGACHVHEQFSAAEIIKLKTAHPEAKVLVHPECKSAIVALADHVGSTAALLKYAVGSDVSEFIVATEAGIIHEMRKKAPHKTFLPVPPELTEGSKTCSCNECAYMRLNTLHKLYNTLKYELPEVVVDTDIIDRARRPIDRMLEISARLGL